MNRGLLLLAFVVAVAADDMIEKCADILHENTIHCCPTMAKAEIGSTLLTPDLKECTAIKADPLSCAQVECIAKKKGYYMADGSINKEALTAAVKKDLVDVPELFNTLNKNCVESDISMFGDDKICDYLKLKRCFHMQVVVMCPEWSDKDDCSGTKDLVDKCAKHFLE
ncbi:uncharacterized protein LOC142975712 [Anticarsia gemmatalis]|uniref:uncharacterized protein LOC142975712 n=1 Tax=Anticarsia gemmatalis TaxID=129554 RepID=UPI003F770FC6